MGGLCILNICDYSLSDINFKKYFLIFFHMNHLRFISELFISVIIYFFNQLKKGKTLFFHSYIHLMFLRLHFPHYI